jgi:hypothetical protein
MENENMLFAIGIPTINRADLLNPTLEKYVVDFPGTRILVIDNGDQEIFAHASITTMKMPVNAGVAGSWNLICETIFNQWEKKSAFVVNDDIYSGQTEDKIKSLILNWSDQGFITTTGTWCAFVMRKETFEKVGRFDEEFSPCYFEDNDYAYRMKLSGVDVFNTRTLSPTVYRNSMTIEKDPKLNMNYHKNYQRYIQKWGGTPGNEKFKTPFNE